MAAVSPSCFEFVGSFCATDGGEDCCDADAVVGGGFVDLGVVVLVMMIWLMAVEMIICLCLLCDGKANVRSP